MSQISKPSPPNAPSSANRSAIRAFWRFSRPHTIIGTSLSVWGVGLITLAIARPIPAETWLLAGFSLLATWITCLCGNVYIVGLNQLEDVDIDRINKPQLPLASGDFSLRQGRWIVGITGVLAIALSAVQGPFLLGMVALSLAIGTAYSLPPMRLKRFPFWASVCIFGVRGMIVNLGLFWHSRAVVGDRTFWLWETWLWNAPILHSVPPIIWALTGFIVVYTFAIAIFKDIPDLEGDRRYNIRTFTMALGTRSVFNLARWVITACYVGMVVAGFGLTVNHWFFWGAHLVALVVFWSLSVRVNLKQRSSIARFYQTIWKLFFLEYLLLPIACWLA